MWKETHGLLPLPRGCVSEEKRSIYKLWPPGNVGITSLQVVTSGIQLGESPPVGTSNILNSKLRGFVWDWLWMLAHPKGFEFSSKLGEDMPERDPVEWVLHASADNVEPWQLLNFFLIFFFMLPVKDRLGSFFAVPLSNTDRYSFHIYPKACACIRRTPFKLVHLSRPRTIHLPIWHSFFKPVSRVLANPKETCVFARYLKPTSCKTESTDKMRKGHTLETCLISKHISILVFPHLALAWVLRMELGATGLRLGVADKDRMIGWKCINEETHLNLR